jgi:hypothetical protein
MGYGDDMNKIMIGFCFLISLSVYAMEDEKSKDSSHKSYEHQILLPMKVPLKPLNHNKSSKRGCIGPIFLQVLESLQFAYPNVPRSFNDAFTIQKIKKH